MSKFEYTGETTVFIGHGFTADAPTNETTTTAAEVDGPALASGFRAARRLRWVVRHCTEGDWRGPRWTVGQFKKNKFKPALRFWSCAAAVKQAREWNGIAEVAR